MKGGFLILLALASVAGCVGANDEPVDAAAAQNVTAEIAEPVAVALAVAAEGLYPVDPTYSLGASELASGATVTVTFRNEDVNPLARHDWVLEDVEGAATDVIGASEETTVQFIAPAPGEYTYFCSVPGHRGRGMEGVLSVV